MRRTFLITAALLATACFSAAQIKSGAAPQNMPAPAKWKVTDLAVAPLFGAIVCGANSMLYLRTSAGTGNPFEGKITALSADGTSKLFDPKEGTGLQGHVVFSAFNVDPEGALYAVANSSQEFKNSYLVAYDKQGHFVWKAALHQPLHATFVLPMDKDHFLISGVVAEPKPGIPPQTFTALFDKGGNELKSLKLPEDDSSTSKDPQTGLIFNTAVGLSTARMGPDGNAYLLKASAVPTVQVLDADGNLLKTFRLTPPDENEQAYDFFLTKNSFAVSYMPADDPHDGVKPSIPKIVLYTASTGETRTTYFAPATMAPSCSEGDSFTFIASTPDRKQYQIGTIELP
jgi:hypothetical protein